VHELAIAESIVQNVLAACERNGYRRVSAVGLRIGVLTDVVPDALEFGFRAITRDTSLRNTVLEIEHVSVQGTCRTCKFEFQVEEFVFVCPRCEGRDISMSQGNELDIAYLDIEDEVSESEMA
jgi:hydrogenase nickel incorporation protein HypA/HybF